MKQRSSLRHTFGMAKILRSKEVSTELGPIQDDLIAADQTGAAAATPTACTSAQPESYRRGNGSAPHFLVAGTSRSMASAPVVSPGRSRTRQELAAARNARKRAAVNDWPCAAGLDEDELDEPGYQPQCGWRQACGIGVADDYPFAERRA